MKKDVAASADKNEIVVYQPEGGEFHIEVRVENETVWLTQAQMAELFNSTRNNVTLHIKNIFQENELDAKSVCKESLLTYLEKQVDFFVKANLPPSEGLLPAHSQWSGYEFAVQLMRSAKKELVIIDPFANDMVLSLMAKRAEGVNAVIYSARITHAMREEEARLNRQFPTVRLENMREVHDRFVIVDDVVYHVGASFKDLGNQMTAFSVLNFVTKEQVLAMVK